MCVCARASIYSYLCEFLQLKEDFVFEFTFGLPACLSPSISVCVYACFSALLWDCRTTSRVLNNESKHERGAKSHCSSLSLCTAFTVAELDD